MKSLTFFYLSTFSFLPLYMPVMLSKCIETILLWYKNKMSFLHGKFGVFFHFGMGTFNNREWSTGYEDPLIFNPAKLNCNQWIKEAKKLELIMRY